MIVELSLLVAVVFVLYYVLTKRPDGLPPGDWGYPIVGNIPMNRKQMKEMIEEQRSKYGDIFSVKMGSHIVIFLADYKQIKAAFAKAELSDRPATYTYAALNFHTGFGISFSNGHIWEENRKFALQSLRDFGIGSSSFEDMILHEVGEYLKYLEKKANKPWKYDWSLNVALINVVWQIVASRRYDIEDKEINNLWNLLNKNLRLMDGPLGLVDYFPWLMYVLPKFLQNKIMHVDEFDKNYETYRKFFDIYIAEHQKGFDKNNIRDYIDAYILDLHEGGAADEKKAFKKDLRNLSAILLSLFTDGAESTASTLRWFMLYMCNYQDIQERIQKDIDNIVGKGKLPSLEHRDKLRYLEACLYELSRIISLVPNGTLHMASEDCKLDGFRIPKGALILPCVEVCHMNPKYFDHPDEFRPERFLDEEGKLVTKQEGYTPFSVGRRVCIGESLAKTQMFLYAAAILQKFKISAPEGQEIDLTPDIEIGFLNYPRRCEIILTER